MISIGGTAIKNFKQEFSWNGEIIMVEFVTMNCVEKQLYQVYLPSLAKEEKEKKIRIHMQRNAAGDFKIVGEGVCPAAYMELEATFDEAIRIY